MTTHFVVGYDGSVAGRRAIDFAIESAKNNNKSVLVAHILEWSPYSFLTPEELEERHKRRNEEVERARQAVIAPIIEAVSNAGVEVDSVIKYGHVADTLCAVAKEYGAEQIFVGRTGQSGIASRIFGSVAGSLVQVAHIPCTIVP